MANEPLNKLTKYYKISILVVFLIGSLATFLTYTKTVKDTKQELLTKVALIANTLNINEIKTLLGNEIDLSNPNYNSLKTKLSKITNIDTENRFAYLWTLKNQKVIFLVDSEPIESNDYSPPGQIYDEATELDKKVLKGELSSSIEFSSDRWGDWLTALVPILDENQNVIAALGIDMESQVFYKNIYTNIAIPILSTIFVLIIIIIGLILRKKENEYINLKEKLLSVARHELRAPLTSLSWLTETMLNNKAEFNEEQKNNITIVHEKVLELVKNVNEIIDNDKK